MSISMIDGAPEHVRFGVRQLAKDGWTHTHLVEWLDGHGVHATIGMVGYYLRKNRIYTDQKWWIDPADTFNERMKQYIAALISHDNSTFRLFDLNMRGRVWGSCTRALLNKGIIEKVCHRWYRIVATKEELVAKLGEVKQ